jgi:antitoxin FitA
MPNLSIKDVPEEIAEALRQRAARNHRSLQGELMAIIQQAAAPAVASQSGGSRRGTRTIEEIAAQHRARYPEPVRGGPLAVDIIRAERDSR